MTKKCLTPLFISLFLITSCQSIGFDKTFEQYIENFKSLVSEEPKQDENIPEQERIVIEEKAIESEPLEPSSVLQITPGTVDTSIYRTQSIDLLVKKVPRKIKQNIFREPVRYLPELVSYLTDDVENYFLKVKIIHDLDKLKG